MRLRVATIDDLEGIYQVECASFFTPWRKEDLKRDIPDTNRTVYLVMEDSNGIIVGFAAGWYVYDEGEVVNIAVLPTYRQQGYGEALLHALREALIERGVEQIFLEVRVSNEAAIHLYERFGFQTVGMRRGYYQDTGEDAYMMVYQVPTDTHRKDTL